MLGHVVGRGPSRASYAELSWSSLAAEKRPKLPKMSSWSDHGLTLPLFDDRDLFLRLRGYWGIGSRVLLPLFRQLAERYDCPGNRHHRRMLVEHLLLKIGHTLVTIRSGH